MVVRKRKKILKKRGHRTAGYGGQKKHRGGGSRGGCGNAGLHKHKLMKMLKYFPDHFGKTGFKRHFVRKPKPINLEQLNKIIEEMIKNKKSNEEIKINLSELGYDKLLGKGNIKYKITVEVKMLSKNALKKLEESGCKVIKVS
ncbi:MAG: uL15 family ribosomal protein [Candidatus Aenigmarchaeota archaeon]|nr:uL15 family ribosomal protein [Candidatus Aenigmarchaeota archaeon]MCX8179475.1 uL15 family ribosomal protein [Candidatus Aenigmarchaeota archaeon]